MDIRIVEKKFPSTDGIHTLVGKIYFPDENTTSKGLFHVVHGMIEHIDRYDAFMQKMAQAGYITFGYDHLGHGKTVCNESEYGYIAKKGGWDLLAKDVASFAENIRSDHPSLPYFLMGHSMGSFVVRVAAEKYITPDRLILMGTGGPNAASGAGITAIKAVKLFRGERHISPFIESLAFGAYNKHFQEENNPYSWLSTDPETLRIHDADPLCNFHFTVSAMQDLIKLNMVANRKAWFRNIASKCPILLVSGSQDPVGNYAKGVKKVYDNLKKAGADVQMHIYENYRHEILNDKCADTVIADIQAFLK